MKNPRLIETLITSATYEIPQYIVTNEGIVDGEPLAIKMCKGAINDEGHLRQEGVFVESLLEMCVTHLQSVNIGDLANRDISMAISHIEDAILRLGKRKADREIRNVLGTYKK